MEIYSKGLYLTEAFQAKDMLRAVDKIQKYLARATGMEFVYANNEEFKNKLTELGITVIKDINLTIHHTKAEIESVIIIDEIQNVVNDYFNDKIIAHDISEIEYFFNTYDFVQCSNIELTFDNYPTYSEPVMFYNDQNNKKLFFADELILLDVLCEEFGINNSDKIE
jgi:hypothetical protein